MKSLGKYAYLNALLRAKLSRAFSQKEMAALAGAADLHALSPLLKGTPYGGLSSPIDEDAPLPALEKALALIEIERYREVLRRAAGAARGIVFSLMEVYDVGKVEGLIRLWKERAWEERGSIIEETICFPIPAAEILKASSIEEIIILLDATPYRAALTAGYGLYRHSGRLFPLEEALETDYYRRLWDSVDALDPGDRAIARRLIGIEVDIRNIEILLRAKRYTSLPVGELRRVLLPGGYSLREAFLIDAYASRDARAILEGSRLIPLLAPAALPQAKDALGQLRLLGALLEQAMDAEARGALAGYPFTIGTVIAYFALRRAEARAVRRIIAEKSLGRRATLEFRIVTQPI